MQKIEIETAIIETETVAGEATDLMMTTGTAIVSAGGTDAMTVTGTAVIAEIVIAGIVTDATTMTIAADAITTKTNCNELL
jgi:hypothetical protein